MSRYKVGLVGLGHIAAGYGEPGEQAPYCHAGGIAQSDKVELAAVADPFDAARSAFEKKWGQTFVAKSGPVAHFAEVERMLTDSRPEIVGICVRGPLHYSVMRQVLESAHRPRAIFLEKPPFCSLEESDEITALAKKHGCVVTMSYSRHWAPHVLQLETLVREGLIGQVQNVVGYAAGAILSFTSHATDLICQFACAQNGSYDPVTVSASGITELAGSEVPATFAAQGFEAEPCIGNITIEFANGVIGTQIGAKTEHGQFYVDVFGDKGHLRAGFDLAPAAWSSDGTPIDLSALLFPPTTSVFRIAYDQIADYLDEGRLPACSNNNWRQVEAIGFAAIESATNRQRLTLPGASRTRRIFANG